MQIDFFTYNSQCFKIMINKNRQILLPYIKVWHVNQCVEYSCPHVSIGHHVCIHDKSVLRLICGNKSIGRTVFEVKNMKTRTLFEAIRTQLVLAVSFARLLLLLLLVVLLVLPLLVVLLEHKSYYWYYP